MPPVLQIALFLLLGAAIIASNLWRERKRLAGWEALAEKYQLRIGQSERIAPDPIIQGLFSKGVLTNYMQGEINGVPVIAFDFTFRFSGEMQQGSGVGMGRSDLALPRMRGVVLTQQDGWTFLYTDIVFLGRRPMKADKIERLWTTLLHAAGVAAVPPHMYGTEEVDGIVIRPARLRRG